MIKHLEGALFSTILTVFIFVIGATVVCGQDAPVPEKTPVPAEISQKGRPELFGQLGLSPDQIQKIRRLNIQRKPQMEAAQLRLRTATKALDEAIYSDALDEVDLAAKLKEVQMAQADVQRLRYMNEIAVRRVLTPEQLFKFRELRLKFAEERERMKNVRQNRKPGDIARPRNSPLDPGPVNRTKDPQKQI